MIGNISEYNLLLLLLKFLYQRFLSSFLPLISFIASKKIEKKTWKSSKQKIKMFIVPDGSGNRNLRDFLSHQSLSCIRNCASLFHTRSVLSATVLSKWSFHSLTKNKKDIFSKIPYNVTLCQNWFKRCWKGFK